MACLDAKHPALREVRAALRQRHGQIDEQEAIDLREPSKAEEKPLCLVLDEKAIEYCGTLCILVLL